MGSSIEANSLFRVEGMIAVVTGGGSGIGLTMAKALATNGAKAVYVLGRRQDVLEAAAKQHSAIVPQICDVGSKPSLQAAVDRIAAEAGHVNLVIANSGIAGPAKRWDPAAQSVAELRKGLFDDLDADDFTQTFHVNVTGAFLTLTAFLDLLDAGNKAALNGGFGAPEAGSKVPSIQSQFIVTSSIAAFSRSNISACAYSSSKAAVLHLAKQASTSLARFGIRANALCPGLFPTEMAASMADGRSPDEETIEDPRFIPAKRFGTDEDMAGTILYLASRAGAFNNGLALVTDGGRLTVMHSTY